MTKEKEKIEGKASKVVANCDHLADDSGTTTIQAGRDCPTYFEYKRDASNG